MNKRLLKIILPIALALVAIAAVAGGVSYAKYIEESKVGTVNLAISGVTQKKYELDWYDAYNLLNTNRTTVTTVIFDRWTSQLTAVEANSFSWSQGTDVGKETDTIRGFLSNDKTAAYFLTKGSAEMMVDECSFMFSFNGNNFVTIELNNFNTSDMTDMSGLFSGCGKLTSLTFGDNFNTSNVTDMSEMFRSCSALKAIDLSLFDTSKVTDMSLMFWHCNALSTANIDQLETGEVTNMAEMFFACYALTEIDVSGFNTSNVTNMSGMFSSCNAVTQLNVSGFDTSKVTDMSRMFNMCLGLTSLDISSFNTSSVTNMSSMFNQRTDSHSRDDCLSKISSLILGASFDTSSVTNMYRMFDGLVGVTDFNFLSLFDTSKVTNMGNMLSYTDATSFDLSSFNTANVHNMSYMFSHSDKVTNITFGSEFVTSNVSSISHMFDTCKALQSLDLSRFDTSKATDMYGMFQSCSSLKTLDLSSFNTAKVKDMTQMFSGCSSLASLNVSSFDTTLVTSFHAMFSNCSSLTTLNLRSFNTYNSTKYGMMFFQCSSLKTIYANPAVKLSDNTYTGWYVNENVDKDYNSAASTIFTNCKALRGGWGTSYNSSNVGFDRLKIDTETVYGYLTNTTGTRDSGSGDSGGGCFPAGTLITLADGSQKAIEDIVMSDMILVFDHEAGQYAVAPILFIEDLGTDEYTVIRLEFSDGRKTGVIVEHAYFDLTLNKYVYIREDNYADFIGHEFAVVADDGYERVVLTNAYLSVETVGNYSLVTAYHLNYFVDGLYSLPGDIEGLFNYFEYDSNTLAYDQEKMQADIATYGLYTYEELAHLIPIEIFESAFPVKYLKVSLGKGLITEDDFVVIIEKYLKEYGIMPS